MVHRKIRVVIVGETDVYSLEQSDHWDAEVEENYKRIALEDVGRGFGRVVEVVTVEPAEVVA